MTDDKLYELFGRHTARIMDEDTIRDWQECHPMEQYKPNPQKTHLTLIAEMLQDRDERMIERFEILLSRKIARLEKLQDTDVTGMSEADIAKIGKQIEWVGDEINTLTHIAKLVIRYTERWLDPALQELKQEFSAFQDRAVQEVEFWKSLYFQEVESEQFFSQLALSQTERLIDTKEKLGRYQHLFIKNNIAA